MKTRSRLVHFVAAAGLLTAALQAQAHHAFSAEFDSEQPVTVKGVVTKLELTNPHSWLYVDVKGADGNVTNWGFEFGAPFSLKEKGITKKTLVPGTEVTINGYRSKNPRPFGYAVTTTLPDGTVYKTGGAQDAPSVADAKK
ncbi:MAG TPA: DUF6152 family protein [Candidatus Acidoferrum sp.]|nr:DUF6152 family protein [Candidatus Acidoferrum sp.]